MGRVVPSTHKSNVVIIYSN